ncbi:MAG: PQQ-binding-like beta-propeller repeat protein [Alphaproteobacteria bacterium]
MFIRILNWAFAALLAAIGGYLVVRGVDLVRLGGSVYYVAAGAALLIVPVLMVLRNAWGARLYALITLATVAWSYGEAGFDLIALLPRLAAWIVVGLWFLMPWYRAFIRKGSNKTRAAGGRWVGVSTLAGLAMLIVGAGQPSPVADLPVASRTVDLDTPGDWRHYGNTPGGSRFSPLDQISPETVSDLKEVWRYRTGVPFEFNVTPLKVGALVYLCTAGNTVIALDAASGAERWRHDPGNTVTGGSTAEALADDNMFSRSCRGLGYVEAPADYDGPCPTRIIGGTTDARLIALDAETGARCADFGEGGEVDARAGLGPHQPFEYMITGLPLIAGDKAVIGGWVIDNQQLGNVSGVVRAFDVYTGALAWAWDVGKPGEQGKPELSPDPKPSLEPILDPAPDQAPEAGAEHAATDASAEDALTGDGAPGQWEAQADAPAPAEEDASPQNGDPAEAEAIAPEGPDTDEPMGDREIFTRGTPNVWSIMSYDPALDLIFAPTGNAAPDYYGAKRRDIDEAVNSSVVALRGATGERVWSFQTVHHDIWDYDVPSQPSLVDITRDGQRIPAVAVPTKRGEIFLLDRRDGTLIHPATTCPDGSAALPGGECPVPQGATEGDRTHPTQPFSGLPNFRPDRLEQDMWGLTPLDQLYCRIEFKKMRYEGHFTPPMPGRGILGADTPTSGGSFQYPGNAGGFNWPGVSVDADRGLLIAQPLMLGNRVIMLTPEEAARAFAARRAARARPSRDEAADRRDGEVDHNDGAGSPDEHPGDTMKAADNGEGGETGEPRRPPRGAAEAMMAARPPYTAQGAWDPEARRFAVTISFSSKWKIPLLGVPTNLPCFEPPYSELAVIDLNTNRTVWRRTAGGKLSVGPFGIIPELKLEFGTPAFGGTMTTRGGLIFQLGPFDGLFRAVDIATGEVLWSQALPGSTKSTPMTYMQDGRQYVVVVAPQMRPDADDDGGGWVIAYALDRSGAE